MPPEDQRTGTDRGDPEAALRRAVWSSQPRWAGAGATRLVIEIADLPGHPARVIARRHKALLESHLAELLARSGIGQPRDVVVREARRREADAEPPASIEIASIPAAALDAAVVSQRP